MPEPHMLIVIAKQRAFDKATWQHLLMAMAHLLHEQWKSQAAKPSGSRADAQTMP